MSIRAIAGEEARQIAGGHVRAPGIRPIYDGQDCESYDAMVEWIRFYQNKRLDNEQIYQQLRKMVPSNTQTRNPFGK